MVIYVFTIKMFFFRLEGQGSITKRETDNQRVSALTLASTHP